MSTLDKLRALGACEEALKWAASRPKKRQTLSALWADCPRGDWMLWLAARVDEPDREGIEAVAWACAHLAQAYAAAYASSYAVACADAAAAVACAYASSYAAAFADADAAVACAYASPYADAHAYASSHADAASYAADARAQALLECADLVRLLVRCPR